MKYNNTVTGRFIDRPNRFIAHVDIQGRIETVHVKNTGRCRELLISDARVVLEASDNPNRKTAYDLIAVYKEGLGIVNIDSQAPNKVAAEWLSTQGYTVVRPEYTYGNSRFDFYMERGEQRYLMEVKGCTLEIGGIGYFPDAPTLRGVKHIRELIAASREGYQTILAFVIQMDGITKVIGNTATHPEFATVLGEAGRAGVEILYLPCRVTEDTISII